MYSCNCIIIHILMLLIIHFVLVLGPLHGRMTHIISTSATDAQVGSLIHIRKHVYMHSIKLLFHRQFLIFVILFLRQNTLMQSELARSITSLPYLLLRYYAYQGRHYTDNTKIVHLLMLLQTINLNHPEMLDLKDDQIGIF